MGNDKVSKASHAIKEAILIRKKICILKTLKAASSSTRQQQLKELGLHTIHQIQYYIGKENKIKSIPTSVEYGKSILEKDIKNSLVDEAIKSILFDLRRGHPYDYHTPL